MRTWKAMLFGLALSGLCLFGAAGCGGSDIPDASDAAYDEAPAEPSLPAPGADAAEIEPVIPGESAPGEPAAPTEPVAEAPAEAEPAAPAEPEAPAEPAEPALGDEAPAARSEGNSATAEMLALATSAPTSTAAAPAGADGSAPGDPTGPGGSDGQLAAAAPGDPAAGLPGEQDPSLMFNPGDGGQPGASSLMPGSDGAMMAGDGYGDEGFGGGGDQKNDPGNTNSPDGAVKAFLHALKTKDRDRLAEATALRAVSPTEGGSHRELFSRIFDNSISDAELDNLASQLDGFRVAGFNQVHSTGRQGVTVRKPGEKGAWLQRTITVRKEKKGWGVLDISSQTKFDAMPRGRGMGRSGGGFR